MVVVIGLVSYSVHRSRVERASQLAAVEQFRVFEDIEHLETSIRAERGYTTSVVLLEGQDAHTNEYMVKQRSHTDEIMLKLPVWPAGLVVGGVQLTTKKHLEDRLNEPRNTSETGCMSFVVA